MFSSETSFKSLPPELQLLIFDLVDVPDLLSLRFVNKELQYQSNYFCKKMLRKIFPDIVNFSDPTVDNKVRFNEENKSPTEENLVCARIELPLSWELNVSL